MSFFVKGAVMAWTSIEPASLPAAFRHWVFCLRRTGITPVTRLAETGSSQRASSNNHRLKSADINVFYA
jgi:hypothetical protein